MMNNKNLRFEYSFFNVELIHIFLFEAQRIKVFTQGQGTEASCEQEKEIQHLRLPFDMKRIQQGTLVR